MTEFRRLKARVDWDDETKKVKFYDGLKNYIKDAMLQVDPPQTLIKLIELAIRIDNRYHGKTNLRQYQQLCPVQEKTKHAQERPLWITTYGS